MLRIYHLIATLLASCFLFYVHGAIIKGNVSSSDNNAVEYASVRISNQSGYLKGVTCNNDGAFTFPDMMQGEYELTVSCLGYTTESRVIKISSPDETLTLSFTLTQNDKMLDEVIIKADNVTLTKDGITIIPTKEQTTHAGNGYDLIRNLMIPGVNLDAMKGSVKAFGGDVALYIDGNKADSREIRQLKPSDVKRVEYIEAPTGKYAGENAVINFILKKQDSGGYIAIDALQRIGYNNSDYNLSMKYYDRNTQYTVFAGTDYTSIKGGEQTKNENIFFPDETVSRDYRLLESEKSTNSQYAQFRVRNKNDRRTLRATLNYVREGNPKENSLFSMTYKKRSQGQEVFQHTDSKGQKYTLGLSGSFNLTPKHYLEASASASLSRNDYNYLYNYTDNSVISNTTENLYNFHLNLTYRIGFHRGNAITFKLSDFYNVSSSDYIGNNTSWQHLWTSETILFGEYSHPLGNIGLLSISPGVSSQIYRLHGHDKVTNFAPRAQVMLSARPRQNQYTQLQAFFGNSFPELSMLTTARQQMDEFEVRTGNPELKQTRMCRAIAVYGIGTRFLNLQVAAIYNGATRMPMADFLFDNGVLVHTFSSDGKWNQVTATISATWTPSKKFNLQLTGGFMHNGYSGPYSLSTDCFYSSGQAAWYGGDFAINAFFESPQKLAGYDAVTTRTIWQYGLSCSWTKNNFRIEAGTKNPFSQKQFYRFTTVTPDYVCHEKQYLPENKQSLYLKLSYSLDFGKKTKHDKVNVDKHIDSGIIRTK